MVFRVLLMSTLAPVLVHVKTTRAVAIVKGAALIITSIHGNVDLSLPGYLIPRVRVNVSISFTIHHSRPKNRHFQAPD